MKRPSEIALESYLELDTMKLLNRGVYKMRIDGELCQVSMMDEGHPFLKIVLLERIREDKYDE